MKKNNQSEKEQLSVSVTFQAIRQLQNHINIDEVGYKKVSGISHADARAYYLYGVIDVLIKVCTVIMRWEELIKDDDTKTEENPNDLWYERVDRLVTEAFIDEQKFWNRKLIEILSNLICFQETNEQIYYRAALAATELDAFIRRNKDYKSFYGRENQNINESIKSFSKIIDETISQPASFWFLDKSVKKPITSKSFKFNSFYNKFEYAFSLATEEERLVLGISYDTAYGSLSRTIHFSAGAPKVENNLNSARSYMRGIGLLLIHVVLRCYGLLSIEPDGLVKAVKEQMNGKTIASQLMGLNRQNHEKGDLVIVYGDLAEVIDLAEGKNGYKSYNIRYLSRPPLPSVQEDWFPAKDISKFAKKSKVREFFIKNLSSFEEGKKIIPIVQSKPDESLYSIMKDFFTHASQVGILDKILGLEKIKESQEE